MKIVNQKVIFLILFLFIIFHVILGENNFFKKQNQDIFPLGLNPSINHDSLSTRNPAIEDPFSILIDLPGGYSFYLSPILVTIPLLSDNLINGFPIPQIIEVINPVGPVLTQLEIQRYLFLVVSGASIFLSMSCFLRQRIIKRRKDFQ